MKKQLLKRLSTCLPVGLALITLLMFSVSANAQIVYTDVIPDTTINKNGGVYNLDLNNDSITDFKITYTTQAITAKCGSASNYTKIFIRITPLSANAVGNNPTYPGALQLGTVIDSNAFSWKNNANQILTILDKYCCGTTPPRVGWCSSYSGNWNGAANKYIPLRLNLKSQKYYGWVRLNVASGAASFTVKDYAYDTTSNQAVLAGCTTPTVSISASGSLPICSGHSVQFNATTNFSSNYQWFKNGNAISGANSSSYKVFSAGAYYVSVSNSCGNANSDVDTVSVFAVDTSVTVSGDTLTANAAGATYQWIVCSNMQPITGATAQTFLPPQYGSYRVIVTKNGCSDTSSCYISCLPPIAALTTGDPLSICSGNSVQFNATTNFSYLYQWFKDGNAISGANSSSYTAFSAGAYYVNVIRGCGIANSDIDTVSVFAVDTSVTVSGDKLTANAASATYQWIDCSTMQPITGATAQTFLPTQQGSFAVIVTENGCSNTSSCYTFCFPPKVALAASGPLNICNGDWVQFNATTNISSKYQWFRNGNEILGADSSSFIATSAGAYYVNVSNSCGNANSSVDTVSVFAADTSVIVKGNKLTANAVGAKYQWMDCAKMQIISGATSQTFIPSQNGSYAVIVTENGCNDTSACFITCFAIDTSVKILGNTLTANAVNAKYQWIDCSSKKIIPGATEQTFSPSKNGSFAVIVTEISCSDTSSCYTIVSTGIQENIFASSITLYPNPASNQLTIDLGNTKQKIGVTITDITGKIMYSTIASETQKIEVSTQDFSAGIYVVQIQTAEFIGTKKLVVKK